jgi:tetratricopeptide (TPR) repeat protein
MKKYIYVLLVFVFISAKAFSQSKGPKTSIEDADEHFSHKNYLMAIPVYKSELKKDPNNNKINYRLGVCYLNTKINRQEALYYLLEYTKDPKCDEDAWFDLGKAYHLNNKIDEAIATFEKFLKLNPKRYEDVKRYIKQCHNAKQIIKQPVNVTIQNLGKDINSQDPDYCPFVNADETALVFTSRRKENIGGKKVEVDGYHSSDVYYSQVEQGKWTKAVNAGRFINSALDEQAVGLKSDGLEMYVYLDHIDKFGDLYITQRKELIEDFPKPKICDPIINDKIEISGCLSEDGGTMFFARKDNSSSTSDLYMCRKLPSGNWSAAQKLPETINTPLNDDFPYLSNDGVTLYFSSEGHNSIGGFDLFKTIWNPEDNTYSEPVNLGYPVNSTDDDRSICVTPDNRVGYISAFKPDGFGDLDIYRITFNDVEQINKIYTGTVFLGDSVPTSPPTISNVKITVTNKNNNNVYPFAANSITGKYVLSLPAGAFKISITADGYENYSEDLTVSDIGKVDVESNKNFFLKKK